MTSVQVRSEPLTYRQDVDHSYFRDLLFPERTAGAEDRQCRHAQEMEAVWRDRDKDTRRRLDASGVEYRVEPNRTSNFAPPLWLVDLFSTAKRPGRVLADLIPNRFELPAGCSSVNLPVLTTGTTVQADVDGSSVPSSDIVDALGSSVVTTLVGSADVPLQMLEQSPPSASIDWAMLTDLSEACDSQLEQQLLYGGGSAATQLVGITTLSGAISVTYTDASPTGSAMWPYLGKASAQLADARRHPPECILMRHARWQWLSTAEDLENRPFGLPTPWYFGVGPSTPDPRGGLNGLPVFDDEAISATLGAGANQDQIVILRPSDLILLEGPPVANVFREALSGSLGARIQLHARVAAVTNRYGGSGVAVVGGSGFAVASGF
jgi:hypothetical protein